jgi:hypothetical protein
LAALADALRGSGLELPDDVRRECNRHIAGKWLFDFFQVGGGSRASLDAQRRLAPEVALTCKNASLASAMIIRIPDPRFPRLNADASPSLVRADGTYRQVHEELERLAALIPGHSIHDARVQLSHWNQLLALHRTGGVRSDTRERSRFR